MNCQKSHKILTYLLFPCKNMPKFSKYSNIHKRNSPKRIFADFGYVVLWHILLKWCKNHFYTTFFLVKMPNDQTSVPSEGNDTTGPSTSYGNPEGKFDIDFDLHFEFEFNFDFRLHRPRVRAMNSGIQ